MSKSGFRKAIIFERSASDRSRAFWLAFTLAYNGNMPRSNTYGVCDPFPALLGSYGGRKTFSEIDVRWSDCSS